MEFRREKKKSKENEATEFHIFERRCKKCLTSGQISKHLLIQNGDCEEQSIIGSNDFLYYRRNRSVYSLSSEITRRKYIIFTKFRVRPRPQAREPKTYARFIMGSLFTINQ